MSDVYSCRLRRGPDGRIAEKIETVQGHDRRWAYSYDARGRLTEARLDQRLICQCHYDRDGRRQRDYFPASHGFSTRDYRYTPDDRLLAAGNNGYVHDANGFRSIWNSEGRYTLYAYAPDYRLLRVEKPDDGLVFEFAHDEDGRRAVKFRDGRPVEAYRWLDFLRLAGFRDVGCWYEFAYARGERTPLAMRRDDGAVFRLHCDQIGSLRVVADSDGHVLKEVLYDPFGGIIEDSAPDLRIPIGFAGGLHDRDLGFVRFGWRDYDTFTGRWTAPDPLGDAGGDPDWYGYCLDDPVNGVDPLGLEGGFWDGLKKIGAGFGKLWDTAPAGIGEAMSKGADGAGEAIGKTVDAFKTNEDLQKYTAVALGAGALPIAAAGAAQAAPAVMTTAMRHPDKVAAATDFVSGFFDPGPPPLTKAGVLGTYAKDELGKAKDKWRKRK